MSAEVEDLSENLETYASSRANFHEASDRDRYRVAKLLHISRAQVNSSNAPNETMTSGAYAQNLLKKKNRLFHYCGRAGISVREAKNMWWNYVYDGRSPSERYKLL